MKLALTSASRRTDDQKRYEAEITSMVQDALVQGKRLVPEGRVDAQVLSGSGG